MTSHRYFACCLPEDLFDRLRLAATDLECSIDTVIDRAHLFPKEEDE